MDTFTLVKRSLAERIDDPLNALIDPETARIGLITTAVQSVVDALTPADGRGRYIVGFQDISTAATSLTDRLVVVSSRPLKDKSLSMIEQAVVIVTFTAHEIGHTHVTEPRKFLIGAHNPHSGYHAVANLADDIILEPFMADRFPILRDAFEFTGLWVLRTTSTLPRTERMRKDMTTAQRFNMILAATRYDTDDIVWAPSAARERDWALDWKRRLLAARLDDHGAFLALCDEAWERIREVEVEADDDEQDEDEPEPPVGPGGDQPGPECEPEPEPDEDADDDEQDDEPDEDADDDEQDEPEPPVDGPTTPPPPDWDDDEPKGKGTGDDDLPEDHPTTDPAPEPKADGPTGSAPSGNSAANADTAKRAEDDFDPKQVDKSTHDQVEDKAGAWEANDMEQRTRHYASSSITAFGLHGTMATTWE